MPARAYWQGQIRLALVSIPVEVYAATKSGATIAFHQIHEPSGKRINYEKVVQGIGPVDRDEIVKGFEVSKGNYVLLDDDEIEAAKVESRKTLDLVQFVDAGEIDVFYFEKPYYVVPADDLAEEAFIVLREAMKAAGKVGIGQISVRGRETLVSAQAVRQGAGARDDALRGRGPRRRRSYFKEIPATKPDKALLDLATTLIEQRTAPFEPGEFHDRYVDALKKLIAKKAKSKGKKILEDVEEPATARGSQRDRPDGGAEEVGRRQGRRRRRRRRPRGEEGARPRRRAAKKAAPRASPQARLTMELNPPILVHWIDVDLLTRLGVAAVLGLLLGLDREVRGRAAGLRTHGLICFAAAAMTVSIIALYHQLGGERDRPAARVRGGGAFIGIIGAGLIVFSKGEVKNLTTAAHLWLTAVIGIACGAGQWPLVAIGAVISVLMLTVLGLVERRFKAGRGLHPMSRADPLAEYNRKRDFKKTAEPAGKRASERQAGNRFIVQKHDATRLHWDFRLEADGVLKSGR